MNTKGKDPPHPAAAPAAHHPQDRLWVLILSVDCADQWPEDRCRVGDLALARAFQLLTTTAACTTSTTSSNTSSSSSKTTTTSNTTTTSSSSRVTLCTDATVEQAQSTLRTVLRDMHDNDDNDDKLLPRTLVVYYGGHGASNGFCMAATTSSTSSNQNVEANEDERSNTSHQSSHDPIWPHDSILAILFNDDNSSSYHSWRPQDQVWFLVDCCYSGNFLQQWQRRCESSMTKSTIILPHSCIVASTAPDTTAGGDWTLTETWLGAMRMADNGAAATCGEQRRHQPNNDQPTTESVSHPNGDHSGQFGTSTTVRHVLNAMQLEILRVKKNKMCFYIFNSGTNEGSVRLEDPFPFRLPPSPSAKPITAMGRFPPSPVQRWQCQLAEQGLFRSYQHRPGSMFWAIWGEDEQLYQGEVMSDEALLGHGCDYDCLSDENGTLGPYIPVHWVEEGTNSVIPLGHCFFHSMSTTCSDSGATIPNIVSWICHCCFPVRKNRKTTDHDNDTDSEMAITVEELRSRAQQASQDEMQRFAVACKSDEPRMLLWDYRIEALRRSMESAGKYLRMPTEFITTQNHATLECWDDHAKSWLRASLVELHNATVHIVATHLEHSEQGDYFVVATEGYQTCLPSALLREALD